ncbi:hypothetical protein DRN94_002685, partial [archaeon]|nr:hypothetical protein [archaeon]
PTVESTVHLNWSLTPPSHQRGCGRCDRAIHLKPYQLYRIDLEPPCLYQLRIEVCGSIRIVNLAAYLIDNKLFLVWGYSVPLLSHAYFLLHYSTSSHIFYTALLTSYRPAVPEPYTLSTLLVYDHDVHKLLLHASITEEGHNLVLHLPRGSNHWYWIPYPVTESSTNDE